LADLQRDETGGKMMQLLAISLELIGITSIGTGIGIELITGADIGIIVITIGSCLVAGGGVIWGKFIKREKK
jgi:hypothetical protein